MQVPNFRSWASLLGIGILVIISLVGVGGLAYYLTPKSPQVDELLKSTFEKVPGVSAYAQEVTTRAEIGDRTLDITGNYLSNAHMRAYASFSTTTITLPGMPPKDAVHSFAHDNIAIGDQIYVRITTESDVLRQSIPYTPQWRQFTRETVPLGFTDIAVSGPILDNIKILGGGGAYLTLSQNHGRVSEGGKELAHYTFRLSGVPAEGSIRTVMERIGESGSVDLWIDAATAEPYLLVMSGPGYAATTTFSLLNNVPLIEAPALIRQ